MPEAEQGSQSEPEAKWQTEVRRRPTQTRCNSNFFLIYY
ncbi:hypothetical protein LEP1GSC058_0195 [Leptospira fainei serovar Hurstbridge str. BUT 6]|uniref:Uncharacterized protein n=1 Tax=Leptospira fainei serovar Hurstbridge str. BUT 6 TaxID=1193011 RepID=S3UWJ4_9LEPT|nr:hypothetical protein LEP1GSC058_0195 [Leptospira fainei serovar Hurstbridge str. BUT 6]